MAPYRKLTQKELKREQLPRITRGILVTMGIRDTLYKTWTEEKDSQFKDRIVALYKCYRNMIGTVLRRSKANYSSFFLSITKITLTNMGRCTEFNVLKKNSTPTKLIYKNKEKTNNIEMAESLNDFFVIWDHLLNLKFLSQSDILFPI